MSTDDGGVTINSHTPSKAIACGSIGCYELGLLQPFVIVILDVHEHKSSLIVIVGRSDDRSVAMNCNILST
eukprot:CAMPEP_0172541128 /NCGR_PEP_ID=MMETSP1067-20121228/11996_1 /TAXON_ID=265564 ORGANISM="Thalassiosira punctigera, Strain Tpunct2005C2" /NCGR_SAMPLE_ID=MMETSP1067 /ASSEMBLY_ACC=CAM_ASM_000444 /LENGTH=70 /DNA_ID=CAMNT_0013327107 /DNA_START=84 /DNA_END=296 /DNA_ORIENTATION=-